MTTRLRNEYCDECGWERRVVGARIVRGGTFLRHMKYPFRRGCHCPDCGEQLCNCIWCKYQVAVHGSREYGHWRDTERRL